MPTDCISFMWQLKICTWQLFFTKDILPRIFLISSPGDASPVLTTLASDFLKFTKHVLNIGCINNYNTYMTIDWFLETKTVSVCQ